MQKPLSVEESMKHIVTPVDFEVKVFVTEEKLGGKPIAMNWDEQGRLWVSITVDYPNELQPAGQGRDRSSSARTPTATACATRSRPSPTSSASRRASFPTPAA